MRLNRLLFLTISVIATTLPLATNAQNTPLNPDRNKPLEITADKSLEWHRTDKFFKALQNVKAKQGDVTLFSDELLARYRESAKSNMEIYHIEATGNVIIDSAKSKAYGDHATYKIDSGLAVMTGKKLRLVSPDQTVTARDRFEYHVTSGKLEAIGKAVAIREGDKLESDRMSASFKENKAGQRILQTLEAKGNVVITTPTEVLTGDYGIYKADTNTAEITGNVKITRGPNVLEGEKAEVDLNTNISKMFGGAEGGGRVRGVFYPGSEEKPEEETR